MPMPSTDLQPHVLAGGCHCGNLSLKFATTLAPERLHPRACDCSFCTKHGGNWVSDPAGRLSIEVGSMERLGTYRQGSMTAELLFCRDCGVLVAATCEERGATLGAVNARCLRDFAHFGAPVAVSPQSLGKDQKIARWTSVWTPNVRITSR